MYHVVVTGVVPPGDVAGAGGFAGGVAGPDAAGPGGSEGLGPGVAGVCAVGSGAVGLGDVEGLGPEVAEVCAVGRGAVGSGVLTGCVAGVGGGAAGLVRPGGCAAGVREAGAGDAEGAAEESGAVCADVGLTFGVRVAGAGAWGVVAGASAVVEGGVGRPGDAGGRGGVGVTGLPGSMGVGVGGAAPDSAGRGVEAGGRPDVGRAGPAEADVAAVGGMGRPGDVVGRGTDGVAGAREGAWVEAGGAVLDLSGRGSKEGRGLNVGNDRSNDFDGVGRGVPPFDVTNAHTPMPPRTSTAAPPAIHGARLRGRR